MTVRIQAFLVTVAAVCVALIEGCAGGYNANGGRVMNADVTLLSFGTVQGELAPCG